MGSCGSFVRYIHYDSGLIHQTGLIDEIITFKNGDTFEGEFNLYNNGNEIQFIRGRLLLKNSSCLEKNGIKFLHDRNIFPRDKYINSYEGKWHTENFLPMYDTKKCIHQYEKIDMISSRLRCSDGNLPTGASLAFYLKYGQINTYCKKDNLLIHTVFDIHLCNYKSRENYHDCPNNCTHSSNSCYTYSTYDSKIITYCKNKTTCNYHCFDSVGTIKYDDGSVYQGQIYNGLPCGEGTMTHDKEAPMKGTWRHGECIKFEYIFGDSDKKNKV
jgi:hypothetical protein